MNKFDLEQMGLQEMSEMELNEVNGGCAACNVVDAVGRFIKDIIHIFKKD